MSIWINILLIFNKVRLLQNTYKFQQKRRDLDLKENIFYMGLVADLLYLINIINFNKTFTKCEGMRFKKLYLRFFFSLCIW